MRGIKSLRKTLKMRWNGEVFVSEFASVQKLVDYLWLRKSGSKGSILIYCWYVSNFCLWANCRPDDVVCKSREELEGLVQRYLDELHSRSRRRGPSARTVNTVMACLKTFFRVNGFNRENNLELRLQSYHQPPRTRNRPEYVPTLDEACLMAERAGSRRNRAVIKTLKSTGLRNTALRAMIVKDVIKELEAGYENLLIKVEPEWNKRIPGACKNSIPYYTFTSADATQAMREMLDERKDRFGSVGQYEQLFISEGSNLKKRLPLSGRELQEIVKNTAKEAGIKDWKHVTPHSLRKVFESVLRSPMKDGDRMDSKDQEFLMGHILPGSQDPYYDWTKINKLRNQFAKLVFQDKKSPEVENLNINRQIARILGIDVDEIKVKKEKELGRPLALKEEMNMLLASIKSKLIMPQEKITEQKIIPKEELQAHLDNGWVFVSTIDKESIIVQKTSSNLANADFAFLNFEEISDDQSQHS